MSNDLTEAQEDYLEAIYDIIHLKGGVRVKDIANKLQVKNSSVTAAMRNLRDSGFINYEPYGVISLTDSGHSEAKRLSETHSVFRKFFMKSLGIDKAAADETACRLEHIMAPEVTARFLQFVKFFSSSEEIGVLWKENFDMFCQENGVTPGHLAAPADYVDELGVQNGVG